MRRCYIRDDNTLLQITVNMLTEVTWPSCVNDHHSPVKVRDTSPCFYFYVIFFSFFSCRMYFHFLFSFDHVIHMECLQISGHNMLNSTFFTHMITYYSQTWGNLWSRVKWMWFVCKGCERCGVSGDVGVWCGFLLLFLSGTENKTSDFESIWCEPQNVLLELYLFSVTNNKENISVSLKDL